MVRTQFFTLTWRMRRPIRNMLNWHQFLRAPPTVPLALAKWRHWKPGKVQDDTPVTQRQLETELRRRWAERLISHLAPYADQIPYMPTIEGDNVMEEYIDLLGDTRFRTLRIRCLALESLQKMGFTSIPWSEQNVRDLLTHLRTQEITPHKLQGIWDPLLWFSSTFGLLELDSLDRLKAKRRPSRNHWLKR